MLKEAATAKVKGVLPEGPSSVPHILVVGLNHQTAPLSLRQRVALPGETLGEALLYLRRAGLKAVVLSTCNRTEVYGATLQGSEGWQALDVLFSQRLGLTTREMMEHLYGYEGERAVHYLYRVACGLDSLLVGETQILGQVRNALERAERQGMAGTYLPRLFRQALSAGRWVRATTGLGRGAASVGTAVVALTRQEMGGLQEQRVLIIGAGQIARQAARALTKAGVISVTVVNRSLERGRELAGWLGGAAQPWHQLERALAAADIVVSCTSAPDIVLDRPLVERALQGRGQRPLLLIDLAVPRDIAPQAGVVPGVRLYDIDQLLPQGSHLPEPQISRAEALVREEADKFVAWLHSRQAATAIRELRHRAKAARQQELIECLGKMPHLGTEERCHLERMTLALMNKLLHGPTVYLKQRPTPCAVQEAVEGMFLMRRPGVYGPNGRGFP